MPTYNTVIIQMQLVLKRNIDLSKLIKNFDDTMKDLPNVRRSRGAIVCKRRYNIKTEK